MSKLVRAEYFVRVGTQKIPKRGQRMNFRELMTASSRAQCGQFIGRAELIGERLGIDLFVRDLNRGMYLFRHSNVLLEFAHILPEFSRRLLRTHHCANRKNS